MHFVPFVEKNEWEGETWTFWLQLDGNKEELVKLYELLSDQDEYVLDMNDIEDEHTVNRMVERTQYGYLAYENKVVGKFTCPENALKQPQIEFLNDMFYKGGIEDHFKE